MPRDRGGAETSSDPRGSGGPPELGRKRGEGGHFVRGGPGLHHVAFEVDGITAELAILRARGAVLVDDEPRPGGQPGLRIAFAHLGPATGLLVELVEYAGLRGQRPAGQHSGGRVSVAG